MKETSKQVINRQSSSKIIILFGNSVCVVTIHLFLTLKTRHSLQLEEQLQKGPLCSGELNYLGQYLPCLLRSKTGAVQITVCNM